MGAGASAGSRHSCSVSAQSIDPRESTCVQSWSWEVVLLAADQSHCGSRASMALRLQLEGLRASRGGRRQSTSTMPQHFAHASRWLV
eukprot:6896562-Prymnesium_polylepis.1